MRSNYSRALHKGMLPRRFYVLERKMEGLVRLGMVHLLSSHIPLYVITEYPRSGGTWVGRLLSSALEMPFPVQKYPELRPSIMHGHYLKPQGIRNAVVVWRDGRDVMVSWYYHCLFFNNISNERLVRETRQALAFSDYQDIRNNLPRFIEYAFTKQKHPNFSWSQFVTYWHKRQDAVHVNYEALHRDTPRELQRMTADLTGTTISHERALEVATEHSFARQAGANPVQRGQIGFLRKGIVGDWRNHFSIEAREVFDYYGGQELLLLDYEHDRSWIIP